MSWFFLQLSFKKANAWRNLQRLPSSGGADKQQEGEDRKLRKYTLLEVASAFFTGQSCYAIYAQEACANLSSEQREQLGSDGHNLIIKSAATMTLFDADYRDKIQSKESQEDAGKNDQSWRAMRRRTWKQMAEAVTGEAKEFFKKWEEQQVEATVKKYMFHEIMYDILQSAVMAWVMSEVELKDPHFPFRLILDFANLATTAGDLFIIKGPKAIKLLGEGSKGLANALLEEFDVQAGDRFHQFWSLEVFGKCEGQNPQNEKMAGSPGSKAEYLPNLLPSSPRDEEEACMLNKTDSKLSSNPTGFV